MQDAEAATVQATVLKRYLTDLRVSVIGMWPSWPIMGGAGWHDWRKEWSEGKRQDMGSGAKRGRSPEGKRNIEIQRGQRTA
jgi:hypothetical protein